MGVPGVAWFSFEPGSERITAVPEPGIAPEVVLDAYYGMGLPLAIQAAWGYEVLHASAVGMDDSVIAFVGVSGTGKSTIAHGLARRGNVLWADDAVAFRADDGVAPTTTALPFEPKLRAESEAFFGPIDTACIALPIPWSSTPLGALFVFEASSATGLRPEVERLSAIDALPTVLPRGFRFRPLSLERQRQIVSSYLELLAQVPVFRVTYAKEFGTLSGLLDAIEEANG